MSEFYRYSPPEAEKPAPLTVENQVERLEHSKTPEVKKDTKFEPSEEGVQDATLSAQRRLKEFGITGKSAMQARQLPFSTGIWSRIVSITTS
jgi:hypothetical protein